MRYLLLISLVLGLGACSNAYKHLAASKPDTDCIAQFKPAITTVVYKTQVDVTGHHLSGLLIIKQMEDSTTRMVFANEAGFTFFDFGFTPDGEMTVYKIIDKMNKKAVIKTLRKDFRLILLLHGPSVASSQRAAENEVYHIRREGKDHYYYVTDPACGKLIRMERGNTRKKVLEATTGGYEKGIPDTIGIHHTNFSFDIGLKRIKDYAQQ
jgi:hypothetical protein